MAFLAIASLLLPLDAGAQVAPAIATAAQPAPALRELSLQDLLSWNSIRSPQLSNNGGWMAYILAPNEGDAEGVVRSTAAGSAEIRVPVGSPPTGQGGQGWVALSGNNRWAAFMIYPTRADAEKASKSRTTLPTRLTVVEMATGAQRSFDRVRSFRFAGDRSDVIALQHMAPAARGGGDSGGGGSAPAAGSAGNTDGSAAARSGSLITIVDLAEGTPVTIAGVGEFAFDAAGELLAYTLETPDGIGNGVQLRDMTNGTVTALDASTARYTRLTWADTGHALAVLSTMGDSATKDTVTTVLGWSRLSSRTPVKVAVDGASPGVPDGLVVSADRAPQWNDAQDVLYFGLREKRPPVPAAEGRPASVSGSRPAPGAGAGGQVAPARQDEDTPSLILWHWKDPRLQSQQQVQEQADRSFSYLAAWHVAPATVVRLADDDIRSVSVGRGDRWALGVDMTPYERQASVDGRALRDLYAIDVRTGERSLIASGIQNPGGPLPSLIAPDGERAVWYDDGMWNVYEFASRESRPITGDIATTFWDEDDDHNVVRPPAGAPFGWSSDSRNVFLRDGWDVWRVPVRTGRGSGQAVNITVDGRSNNIRYQARVGVNPKEYGIDLSRPILMESYGELSKKEGLARVDPDRGGTRMLAWEEAKVDYRKPRDANLLAYTRQTFTTFPDWYAADADLSNERRLTDANPQQAEVAWSAGARLVNYTCENGGKEMQGALFLPANYEAGRSYPTLTYIYERLTQNFHVYAQPNATRYANPSVYTSRGYAYFMPDISYQLDDPGRSAVWCVVPAVKAAIATGVVDPARVGLQGHSWGGYQTAFITTQTDIFRTAVAGAPLTDMTSMFSSVYWNSGSANQPIFISSQGRFRSGFVENPEAYIRNSPNRFAQNLDIPLMLLHNDRDGAVDFNQGITYFNTLRALGKDVVLLEYVGENHGLSRSANQKDYAVRMMEWFDHFLRDRPAPEWILDGVPRLRMEEHLRSRRSLVDPKADSTAKADTAATPGGQVPGV